VAPSKIVPGETTLDEVIRLYGVATEEYEQFPPPTGGRSSIEAASRRRRAGASAVLHRRALEAGIMSEDRARAPAVRDVKAEVRHLA
jgi:hypothetical protein